MTSRGVDLEPAARPDKISEEVRSILASDQSLARLGIVVTQAAGGEAVAQQTIDANMANGLGIAQGGFVFALADVAFACAANSLTSGVATADASISYVTPARLGEELCASATVTYFDQKRLVVDVVVRSGERVVALFHGTARRLRPQPPGPAEEGVSA